MKRNLLTISGALASLTCIPSALAATSLSQSWKIHKASEHGAVVLDTGTVRGAPYGPGTIRVTTTAHADGTISLTFRQRLSHGTLTGRAQLTYRFSAAHDKVLYRGSGRLTGGTGRYAHAHGGIRLKGTGLPSGDATIKLSGA